MNLLSVKGTFTLTVRCVEALLVDYMNSINQLKDALQQLEILKYKSSEKKAQDLRHSLGKGIEGC
jgi:hypothetical protein